MRSPKSQNATNSTASAAAELGRYRRDDDTSFDQVVELANQLTEEEDIIAGFFQPSPGTRPIFDSVAALGDAQLGRHETVIGKYLVAFRAVAPHFPVAAMVGGLAAAAPGALFVVPAARLVSGGDWFDIVYLAVVASLTLLGVLVGATIGTVYQAQKSFRTDVRENFWGMCSGLTEPDSGGQLALTDWMHQLVEDLAGPKPDDAPVTFGDLWFADRAGDYQRGMHARDIPASRAIDLQVITTCLTDGRPYRFPFRPGDDERQQFYFRPDELRRLFPAGIVDWLVEHPPEGLTDIDGIHPMPSPADVPILMAARLSLSFPALLSAIPLYRRSPSDEFSVCWFSDGGIASNFPIHCFDSPVPRWPTLAINLAGPPEEPCSDDDWRDHPDICQQKSIWLIGDRRTPLGNVSDFAMAIFNTARNWSDNTQAALPGYRDRIIYVGMNPGEGGMNLNMPRHLRARLSERGALAGAQIRDRFHLPDVGDHPRPTKLWDLHRWTRYRSSMAVIQGFLGSFHRGYRYSEADPRYEELIESGLDEDFPYRWRDREHLERALDATESLDSVASEWRDDGDPEFGDGAPRPQPEVRIRPRI